MRRLVALLALIVLSGCSGTAGAPQQSSSAPPCVPAGPAAAAPSPLDLTLACFDGGEVTLSRLGGPAVVNLWASWCEPCRHELPAMQGFAAQAGASVRVVGVITGTTRDAAQSIIDELGLTFPMLYDREMRLLAAVDRVNLPLTLFVDGSGKIAYLHNAAALDPAALRRLTAQYLGVTVAA